MRDSILQNKLCVSVGQYSLKGRKEVNQDFHGALIPHGKELALKGITLAVADGISSSGLSHEASEIIVKSLMTDYYCTSDAWTVKTAASKVILATNSWLYGENRRARINDMNLGRVCTLSSIIFKSRKAHLFHVGDSYIWRLSGNTLEPLTNPHTVHLSEGKSYLGRSIGSGESVEIDYHQEKLEVGDLFLLSTDGVHEYWRPQELLQIIQQAINLDEAARDIVTDCYENGSTDNLTLQIARIDHLPTQQNDASILEDTLLLPLAPTFPRPGEEVDEYKIVRNLISSARSHIFLAKAQDDQKVVLKYPSVDLRESEDYLRRFVMEEWIARRINSPHVLGAVPAPEKRTALYTVTEFVEGQTLRQWMTDNPNPSLANVRDIVQQIAMGLRAFHRMEMVHQDIRPENIMIDDTGTVKIIDFGSTCVAGVQEVSPTFVDEDILGTLQYSAPEYFLGHSGSATSDLYSLGVIAYEMLTGSLPYGAKVAAARTTRELGRLKFKSTVGARMPLPDWVEFALSRAVHVDPQKRYQNLSEFLSDLKKPSSNFKRRKDLPLIERNPLVFWRFLTFFFASISVALLVLKL